MVTITLSTLACCITYMAISPFATCYEGKTKSFSQNLYKNESDAVNNNYYFKRIPRTKGSIVLRNVKTFNFSTFSFLT